MSDTKLRPEDLRAKAEALIAFTREGPLFIAWVQAVTDTLAPAPEKAAKVECPNCRQKVGPGWDHEATPQRFTCQPAQPEPAATVCEACEGIRSDLCAKCSPDEPAAPEKGAWIADGFGNTWKKCERENCGLEIVRPGKVQCVLCESESVEPAQPEPAAPEMPEAVYIAANTLRASGHVTLADALLKESWHSQPVAVGMTEELEHVLAVCDDEIAEARRHAAASTPSKAARYNGEADAIAKSVAAVRQRAAQVKL